MRLETGRDDEVLEEAIDVENVKTPVLASDSKGSHGQPDEIQK